jgi:non-ribosomal peptide synthetase component F
MVGYSLEMIIGVLGIWKAGGVYLPIDSKYPENRINFMLKDSKAEVLLTAHEIREICRGTAGRGPGRQPAASLAYIIYTSGTTGKPKGVLLKNENLTNYVTWFSNAARLTPADKSLLVSSFAFDLGYTAVYPSLANGGQLHIVSNEIFMSPGHLSDYIYCHHITYLKMTPSLFSTLVDPAVFSPQTFQRLRLLVLGGEEIVVKDVERLHAWCGHIEVMNHYGPTESTIGSAAGLIAFNKFDEYEKYPVIGRPISNTRVFILDRNFMTVPIGVPGELCIGGPGVARGISACGCPMVISCFWAGSISSGS